jgi:GrpB-like predicted nucleotidyltransferase (UPF0157 family)
MARTVVICDYDADWQSRYQREASALHSALGSIITGCHHIGSTAIAGLAAKPVIDILLEVSDLGLLDIRADAIKALGYEARGENGISGRRFYQKGGDERSHHIHAFQGGVPDVHRHLCFRDYLKAHPEDALAYAELKRDLASRFHEEPERYVAAKAVYVRQLEQRALHWSASGIHGAAARRLT